MKNVFKFALLLAFAVSAFAWTGCSKDDKKSPSPSGGSSSIIGTWERDMGGGGVEKMELKSGGQYIGYEYKNGILISAGKGEFSYTATELTVEATTEWDISNDANGNRFPDADEFVPMSAADIVEIKVSYTVSGDKLEVKEPTKGNQFTYTRTTSPQPTNPANPPDTSRLIGIWEVDLGREVIRYEFSDEEYVLYTKSGSVEAYIKGALEFSSDKITMQEEYVWSAGFDTNKNGKPDPDEYYPNPNVTTNIRKYEFLNDGRLKIYKEDNVSYSNYTRIG